MKQYSQPLIIRNNSTLLLEKISLGKNNYNEEWIQDLCFNHPNLLPINEIEPSFCDMVPICKELMTDSGPVDLIYINQYGFITIGECKLWKNPEARRKVIGQILDYAKDIAKWDYNKLEIECLKKRGKEKSSLIEIIRSYFPDTDEASFIDNVQNNLRKGRFLLAIIGDGIRENMEELSDYLLRHGNLSFTLSLIELPVYKNPFDETEIVITPRILLKTKEIERVVYKFYENRSEATDMPITRDLPATSISENVFYERLQKVIGSKKIDELRKFIKELDEKFNIKTSLGRGIKISMNLKTYDDKYNFASIQENGDVINYSIVTKTAEIGDRNIGINYLNSVAKLLDGVVETKNTEWHWTVKRKNAFINIADYLIVKQQWEQIIAETLTKIYSKDENE